MALSTDSITGAIEIIEMFGRKRVELEPEGSLFLLIFVRKP